MAARQQSARPILKAEQRDTWISNRDYPLWKVVRASTAAPSYFDPRAITIASEKGKKASSVRLWTAERARSTTRPFRHSCR